MFAVSNYDNVHCVLDDWCINISCGNFMIFRSGGGGDLSCPHLSILPHPGGVFHPCLLSIGRQNLRPPTRVSDTSCVSNFPAGRPMQRSREAINCSVLTQGAAEGVPAEARLTLVVLLSAPRNEVFRCMLHTVHTCVCIYIYIYITYLYIYI